MLFNSAAFGAFLIIALILFWSAPHSHRVYILVGVSLFFYLYSYPIYFFLLLILIVLNFALALEIARKPKSAGRYLFLAVALDLLSIGFYKYANFATQSLQSLLNFSGAPAHFPMLDLMLPLGISFFTFQMMSYVIDTYRGEPPEESLWNFAAYVSFFPQLVAGPIVRPKTLLPQIKTVRTYDDENAVRGIFLVAQGLVKKIVFADFLGVYVEKVFAAPADYSGLATLVAVYAYAFQIYFDFSGYTDIAIGCGKLFGFEIPINFNLPYISKNPREFWRRWHISLSTWLRDYLYIPLGGNRKGGGRTHFNLMTTMVLGGLWHGANWTFVLWGFYHGALISVQRFLEEQSELFRRLFSPRSRVMSAVVTLVTFHLVCLGWILFRSESLAKAGHILTNIVTAASAANSFEMPIVLMLAIASLSHIVRSTWKMEEWYVRLPAPIQAFGYSCATIFIFLFFTTEQRFIYFQF
ncbi:MAG: MBOAT family protein [Candidatus Abyssobacteria bacterium SURF_17]|uniref:MBOAT family protein n=1 Tax=Candidatus Abyssobacteria bacterium SURF_17 TaxID=2093361 RepID=A0A419EUH2_9BACT|nr:MAG: MBOAT family protein [Candidatus Abyssubacteria bacterium SURF_17]